MVGANKPALSQQQTRSSPTSASLNPPHTTTMSHPPPTPDPHIPSALTRLFAEGDHFLRQSEDDMLIDPGLEDEPAVGAIAAAVADAHAQAQAGGELLHEETLNMHVDDVGVDGDVQLHDVALHEQTRSALQDQSHPHLEANAQHDAHTPTHLPQPPIADKPPDEDRGRKYELSALEVLSISLQAENDRLRRAISTLEGEGIGLDPEAVPIVPDVPISVDHLEVDDLSGITQHTLRELASAAVGEGFVNFPGLESLQHLENEVEHAHEHIHVQEPGSGRGGEPSEPNPATLSDFLHGLVAQVTVPRGSGDVPHPTVDPFDVTRRALDAEIASTRAAIAAKEAEIAAAKAGQKPDGEENGEADKGGEGEGAANTAANESTVATPAADTAAPDKAALDAQLAKVGTALESARRRAAVLRDAVLRVKRERDAAAFNVLGMEAELAVLGDGAEGAAAERALRDVRAYIEDMLKAYKEVSLTEAGLTTEGQAARAAAPVPPAADARIDGPALVAPQEARAPAPLGAQDERRARAARASRARRRRGGCPRRACADTTEGD